MSWAVPNLQIQHTGKIKKKKRKIMDERHTHTHGDKAGQCVMHCRAIHYKIQTNIRSL